MILSGCQDLLDMPSRMRNLINLIYLDIFGCISLKEMSTHHGIERLKELRD